nr:hypothetical protein [Clostridia bacterium]
MKTKLTAFMLALLTLTSVFASCSSDTETPSDPDNGTTAAASPSDAETTAAESTRAPLEVPDKDY